MSTQPDALLPTSTLLNINREGSSVNRVKRASAHPLLLVFLWSILLLLIGCRNDTPAAISPAQPLPDNGPSTHQLLSREGSGTQQPPDSADGLVLWVPPFVSINTASRADAVLAAALAEFAPTPAGSSVTLIPKAERGPARMLSYLLTTSQAASQLMPDIVLLNSFDLPHIVEAGLLPPLAEEESALFQGIPPQLLQTAELEGSLYGLPFIASLEHLVYGRNRLLLPPATWDDFLSQDKRLLFPGSSVDDYSVSFIWTLYLTGGGRVDEAGNVADPEILRAALEFLDRGREMKLIPDSALTLSSPQAVWTFFVNGNAEMAVVPADLYYNQLIEAGAISFASLPTLNGEAQAVVTSWSFVILTQEPERRQKAVRLLQQLFTPQIQGEWSSSARQVPTQPAAFAYWDEEDPYTLFLQEMLLHSVALPSLHTFGEITHIMQQAQRDILAGEKSPQEVLDTLPLYP